MCSDYSGKQEARKKYHLLEPSKPKDITPTKDKEQGNKRFIYYVVLLKNTKLNVF